MNYAWPAHLLFTINDESLTYCALQLCEWWSVDVSWMNVIPALFMRDMKLGRQWTDVDVRGFEQVPTHKHWRPTRVSRIFAQSRKYARRLLNNAHRRTLLRRKFFWTVQNSKSSTNHLQCTCTYTQWRSTFDPPTNYAYDARSTHRRKYVRTTWVIRAFSLCDWPLSVYLPIKP